MGYHRSYGLSGVVWKDGVPVDENCPERKPIRFTTGGVPIWGMTSASGWAAKPITNPDQIPCGQKQVDIKTHDPIKKVAMIGAGAVALSTLGPQVFQAGKAGGIFGGGASAGTAASGAATAAESGGMFSAIKEQGNRVLNFVNQGRAINAIANGEIPPPPVSITGNSFLEWGFQVAKDELVKKHQRELTRMEEQALKQEIAAIQSRLQQRAGSQPMSPNPAVPESVQRRQQQIVVEQQKKKEDLLPVLLAVGLPALLVIAMKG